MLYVIILGKKTKHAAGTDSVNIHVSFKWQEPFMLLELHMYNTDIILACWPEKVSEKEKSKQERVSWKGWWHTFYVV